MPTTPAQLPRPDTVLRKARAVSRRGQMARFARVSGGILLSAAGAGAALVVADKLLGGTLTRLAPWWTLIAAPVALGALAGGIVAWLGRWTPVQASMRIDEHLGLKSRLATALELWQSPSESASPVARWCIDDAERRAAEVDPARVVPVRPHWVHSIWPAVVMGSIAAAMFLPARSTERSRDAQRQREVAQARTTTAEQVADVAQALAKDPDQPIAPGEPAREAVRQFEDIRRELMEGRADPERARLAASEQLDDLASSIEQGAEQRLRDAERAREALAKASRGQGASAAPAAPAGAPAAAQPALGELGELRDALAQGDLPGAAEALQQLDECLNELTPEQREAIARELEDLAKKVESQAEPQPDPQSDLRPESRAESPTQNQPRDAATPRPPGQDSPPRPSQSDPSTRRPTQEQPQQPDGSEPRQSQPRDEASPDQPRGEQTPDGQPSPSSPQQPSTQPSPQSSPTEPSSDRRSMLERFRDAARDAARDLRSPPPAQPPDGQNQPQSGENRSQPPQGQPGQPPQQQPGERGASPKTERPQGDQTDGKPPTANSQPNSQPNAQPSTQPGPQPSAPSNTQPSTQPGSEPKSQPQPKSGEQPSSEPKANPNQPSTPPPTPPTSPPSGTTAPQPSPSEPRQGSGEPRPQPAPQNAPGTPSQPPPSGQPGESQPKSGDTAPAQSNPKPSDSRDKAGGNQSEQGAGNSSAAQDQRAADRPGPAQGTPTPGKTTQPQPGAPGQEQRPQASPGNQPGSQPGARPAAQPGTASKSSGDQTPGEGAGAPMGDPDGTGQDTKSETPLARMARALRDAGQAPRDAREAEQQAERLREMSRKLQEQMTPEQQRELARLAREYADASARRSSETRQAPRASDFATRPVDARGQRDPAAPRSRERVIAEWTSERSGREPATATSSNTAPTELRRAADAADRAIEQQAVPRKYADLVRRVFERYSEGSPPPQQP